MNSTPRQLIMSEHEAFERAFNISAGNRNTDGIYFTNYHQDAWEGWQKRAETSQSLVVFKSLSDKVEDGEVSIDELCKPERDERQRERAIELCRDLAIPEDEQVIKVIIYALNLWMDWEIKHLTPSPEPPTEEELRFTARTLGVKEFWGGWRNLTDPNWDKFYPDDIVKLACEFAEAYRDASSHSEPESEPCDACGKPDGINHTYDCPEAQQ